MVQALIFDCFGVLTTDTWRAFLDSLPGTADIDRARELNRQYDAGFLTKDEFLEQVHEATGGRPEQVEEMLDNEITKNLPLFDYIRELKKSYRIGLLSNVATPWITDSFLSEEEQGLFDEMIFSFQVGITKPDPRIFMLACERLRTGPHEVVLIDDNAGHCAAARTEGLAAIVYEDLRQLKSELEPLLYPA